MGHRQPKLPGTPEQHHRPCQGRSDGRRDQPCPVRRSARVVHHVWRWNRQALHRTAYFYFLFLLCPESVFCCVLQSSSGNYVPPSSAAIQAANSSYNQARFQQTTLSSNSDFQQRKVGEVGGGWGSATAPAIASSTKSSSQKAFGAVAASAAVGAHQEEEEEDDDDDEDEDEEEEEDHDAHHANGNGLSVDRNSPEYRVVTEITQLGVRAHPTREALAEFNQRTRSMNGAVLAAALAQVLAGEEGSHQLVLFFFFFWFSLFLNFNAFSELCTLSSRPSARATPRSSTRSKNTAARLASSATRARTASPPRPSRFAISWTLRLRQPHRNHPPRPPHPCQFPPPVLLRRLLLHINCKT